MIFRANSFGAFSDNVLPAGNFAGQMLFED
jgi:hypothetical protein